MHNQFLLTNEQLPNFGSYSPIVFQTQLFVPPPIQFHNLIILKPVIENFIENEAIQIDIPDVQLNPSDQEINFFIIIITDYLKQSFITFQSEDSPEKSISSQQIESQLNQNNLLENYLHEFMLGAQQKNIFMFKIIHKIHEIKKQEFRNQIVYILIHIFYEFCFYLKKKLQPKEFVDKAILCAKNLTSFILENSKVHFVIPYSQNFETISERDNIFEAFLIELTLLLWQNCLGRQFMNWNKYFQFELQEIRKAQEKIKPNNLQKSVTLDQFLSSINQSQCIYYDSQEQEQFLFCTQKKSRIDLSQSQQFNLRLSSSMIKLLDLDLEYKLNGLDINENEETLKLKKKQSFTKINNAQSNRLKSMSFSTSYY